MPYPHFVSKSEVSAAKHTPWPLAVKVERTCPRCHTRAYHRGNDRGVANRIACVNCGHEWIGRIRRDEQRHETRDEFLDRIGRDDNERLSAIVSKGREIVGVAAKRALDSQFDQDYFDDYGRRAAIAKATGSAQ